MTISETATNDHLQDSHEYPSPRQPQILIASVQADFYPYLVGRSRSLCFVVRHVTTAFQKAAYPLQL